MLSPYGTLTQYFWSIMLPDGRELQIRTEQQLPREAMDSIHIAEIVDAQVFPRRLDANV